MRLENFWAKSEPFQSVPTHALISGHVAQLLFDRYLSADDRDILSERFGSDNCPVRDFVGYLVSLHDIGKLDISFQGKDSAVLEQIRASVDDSPFYSGTRHEKTGKQCLIDIWKELGQDRRTQKLCAGIVGAHHQGRTGKSGFIRSSPWYSFQKELERSMRNHFLRSDTLSLPVEKTRNGSSAAALLLGLVILADWISSGSAFLNGEELLQNSNPEGMILKQADSFFEKSGLLPHQIPWPDSFCQLWPAIPPQGLRQIQAKAEELFREREDPFDLILIEAPMGEGKTEAGIYAALQMAKRSGKDGLYMAMPTAATSNQMVMRLRKLIENHDPEAGVRLLHSMSWLEDSDPANSEDEADEIARWLAPVKRGLLGQYAVGTVDQAMLAATKARYSVLRLLGLSNKALVIDEIHSYDAYMTEILTRLLSWCRALHIPVVMLSATLSPGAKKKLLKPYTDSALSTAYPLLTAVTRGGQLLECPAPKVSHRLEAEVQLSPLLGDPGGIGALAAEKVKEGGCLCVLMNTVKEAQEVYQALREQFEGDLLLFHAQFPAGQRAELEKECLRRYGKDKTQRPKKSILVCTQVVEQSLDVDFDVMITAVAPIDLVLQRLGRVYRHEDTPRPSGSSGASLLVLVPGDGEGFGPSGFVYPDCYLRRSVDLLRKKAQIRVPEDLAELVREGYDDNAVPEAELDQWWENKIEDQIKAGASGQYLINPPEKSLVYLDDDISYEDDEDAATLSVKTRLGEPTVRIALLEKDLYERVLACKRMKNGTAWATVTQKDLAEQVMRQSVSVRKNRLRGFKSCLLDIPCDKLLSGVRVYPAEQGVCCGQDGKRILFDPELGFLMEEGEV